MKRVVVILFFAILILPACKAKYSFNSREGKAKLKHYNSIQFGNTQYPNAHKTKTKSSQPARVF